MKVCGLIAEYNPFHNGHNEHLRQAKELSGADVFIVAMSPNFVQRGEPSIMGKERRVHAAIDNGVDLVVEIPTIYAVESADIFAYAALHLLNDLKVDCIVFGTESGDTNTFINKFAKKDFASPRMDEIIQDYLAKGYSYPKAKSEASKIVNDFYLENPNDILGYSYLKVIHREKLNIKPLCYIRDNNEKCLGKSGEFSSALSIRNALKTNIDTRREYNFLDDYFDILKYRLEVATSEELKKIHLVEEGIENLLKKSIRKASNMSELINLCTSKRYSGARIKRTIIHILLNTSKDFAAIQLKEKPPYVRILGSSPNGRKYLASIRKDCETNIVTRFSAQENPLLLEELKASDLYYAIKPEPLKSELQELEKTAFPVRNF